MKLKIISLVLLSATAGFAASTSEIVAPTPEKKIFSAELLTGITNEFRRDETQNLVVTSPQSYSLGIGYGSWMITGERSSQDRRFSGNTSLNVTTAQKDESAWVSWAPTPSSQWRPYLSFGGGTLKTSVDSQIDSEKISVEGKELPYVGVGFGVRAVFLRFFEIKTEIRIVNREFTEVGPAVRLLGSVGFSL